MVMILHNHIHMLVDGLIAVRAGAGSGEGSGRGGASAVWAASALLRLELLARPLVGGALLGGHLRPLQLER